MPRGHYERKPRTDPKDVAENGSPEQVLCAQEFLRLELVRVVGAPGISADRIIATVQALEAFIKQPAA